MMIDQTTLVHDTLSLIDAFEVVSTTGAEPDFHDDDNVLGFRWLLVSPDAEAASLPVDAELIATFAGNRWVGVRIH